MFLNSSCNHLLSLCRIRIIWTSPSHKTVNEKFMWTTLCFEDDHSGIPDSSSSCGGSLPLSYSFPNTSFSTPFYYHPSNFDVYMECVWVISVPAGEEVQLAILDNWFHNEVIYIYDHPYSTSSSFLVSTLSGNISGNNSGNATVVQSTRGGLTMLHDDYSYTANGKGILAEIIIAGILPQSE